MIHPIPCLTLANQVQMPALGLGTWPMNDEEAEQTVKKALQMGYRLIDTAENYQNETGVGAGINTSGIPRQEIFVTTKFNRKWHSVAGVRQACEASLSRMKLDYIDLLLIHWPNPDQDRYLEAFEGLEAVLKAGLVRAIGTSNFKPAHLQRLFDAGYTPHVNQIQLDPYHPRAELTGLHQQHHIITESWSPIGRGNQLLAEPLIQELARQHQKTPAQIVLRWHVQQGLIPTPKSSSLQHLQSNLSVFDFTLSPADMSQLATLAFDDPELIDADQFGH